MKTGKSKTDVSAALDVLVKGKYIHSEDRLNTSNIVILEGWEREEDRPNVKSVVSPGSIGYWTQY
ncbi:MAG: hypothetical protein IKE29_13955 [Paenibacillus sp.]|uniref:hypothetical protein n=1 Tax=Paenibacillus sp. TaxID=58172 RepID=UPI0025FC24B1|nr:hypothetical protein [Paenibacillus sp.]MBR2565710.1 hypothetical protein [Paenibacillus sp.]